MVWLLVVGAPASAVEVPVSPLMADRPFAGVGRPVEAALTADGRALAAVGIGGCRYAAGTFPQFVILSREGQRTVAGADPAWTVERTADGTVRYRAHGLVVTIAYVPQGDALAVVVRLVEEGDWRLISVGGTVLSVTVSKDDAAHYLVDGSGRLAYPDVAETVEAHWDCNADNMIGGATNAGFVGWREPERIVFVKPLTFSHQLGWTVTPGTGGTRYDLDAALLFRPPATRLFETVLCHDALALRVETAGDANRDGSVDWVDAGIAYRERYLKRHAADELHRTLRDSFRVYNQVWGQGDYARATGPLLDIDFAEGIWWMKGMMKFVTPQDSEGHPYTVEPNPQMDDIAPYKAPLRRNLQHSGIYYGHDYPCNFLGDWPDELIKRNPDNQPYPYGRERLPYHQKHYLDNRRGIETGLVFRHYDQIVETCRLGPGDPVMLDTYTAFARCGYRPEAPTTPELETAAKRTIADYLRRVHGLSVAGEGLIEGVQDVVDYGAYAVFPPRVLMQRTWERKAGQQSVPLLPVLFGGSGYYGCGWYELRNPDPNWCVGMVYGVGYWDWNPQGPERAWIRYARYFFNQNVAWSKVADARVTDLDQTGARFVTRYDTGAVMEADLDANRWVLTLDGVRYDGFTPFSSRGAMAILRQGDFDVTVPGEHHLRLSPHQPFADQSSVKCEVRDGATRITGHFGGPAWDIPVMSTTPEGKETTIGHPSAPVLVLVPD